MNSKRSPNIAVVVGPESSEAHADEYGRILERATVNPQRVLFLLLFSFITACAPEGNSMTNDTQQVPQQNDQAEEVIGFADTEADSTHDHDIVLSRKGGKMSDGLIVMDDKTLLITMQALLEKIDTVIAAQNWDAANKLLKQALIELGYRYHHSFIDDDTGMKLVKADFLEKEGKFDNAARMRRRIFAERLEMFRSKPQ